LSNVFLHNKFRSFFAKIEYYFPHPGFGTEDELEKPDTVRCDCKDVSGTIIITIYSNNSGDNILARKLHFSFESTGTSTLMMETGTGVNHHMNLPKTAI